MRLGGGPPFHCLRVRDTLMLIDDATLLSQWQDGSLPFEAWTHEAHLRVAFQLARGHDDPVEAMSAGILKFNSRHRDKLSTGFHTTLTRFWMEAIVSRSPAAFSSFDAFARAFPELLDSEFPLDMYHRRVLFSDVAKRSWVPPLVWTPHPGSCPCPSEEKA